MAWSLGHGQLDTRGETSEVEKGRFYQKNASWTIFCAKWPQKYRYSSIYIAIAAKSFLKEGEKKRSPDIYVGFSPWIYGFGKESPHKESGQKS